MHWSSDMNEKLSFSAVVAAPQSLPAPSSRLHLSRAGAVAMLAVVAIGFAAPRAIAAAPPEGFAHLVEKVKPAVVNIASTEKVAQTNRGGRQFQIPPGMRGTPFEDFLRRFFDQQQFGRGDNDDDEYATPGPRREATALGSGFIIDASGYVVTNNHVVANADKIQVTLQDGRKFDANVIGRDEKTDVALLKVESKDSLPHVSWGDSDKLRDGDWVIAVGNPFGLGGTVTAGIVSARGRNIQSGPYDDYLQIDAAINRGNSGGPSFNRDGQVIGINTAIYSPNGGSIGIGFAVPASVARPIVDELRAHGKIERGWLGVTIQPLTKDIADSLGLPAEKGALVAGLAENGPGAKAGLRQGDVIRSVDGKKVEEFRDLARTIAVAGPDKTVKLVVWRDGKETPVEVKLGLMPNDRTAANDAGNRGGRQAQPTSGALGLTLAPVTPDVRSDLDLPKDAKGAVVTAVRRGSPAAKAGLNPGDVIVKAGDKAVDQPRDVVDGVRAAEQSKQKAVLLLVERGSNSIFVAVPLATG
jgi:serine protease Do